MAPHSSAANTRSHCDNVAVGCCLQIQTDSCFPAGTDALGTGRAGRGADLNQLGVGTGLYLTIPDDAILKFGKGAPGTATLNRENSPFSFRDSVPLGEPLRGPVPLSPLRQIRLAQRSTELPEDLIEWWHHGHLVCKARGPKRLQSSF